MKRIAAVLMALITLVTLSACGGSDQDRDLYQYDTFLNAKWGSDPDQVFADLGLSKKQVARQGETIDREKGYPEGTFSYKITKKSSMYGLPVSVELLFADHLFGLPQHIGLYAVKVTFLEDYPSTFSANSIQWEPSDYKLDADLAMEEINKRILYNTEQQEETVGLWTIQRWACKTTPSSVPGEAGDKLREALQSITEGDELTGTYDLDQPLSVMELYYDNPDEYSYMVYNGFAAALLRNI